jgi:hypothetical protein
VGFSRSACGYGTCSHIRGPRRRGLSHSWLFPFAWQTEISPSRGSHSRGVFAVPDLHREVHATVKRLASSERANFRAGAPSLADSPVPDYVMFAKEFQSGISLRSTRLNLLNCGDLNCQRAHPKGAIPFSPVRVDRKRRGSTRLFARLRTPKPLRKQVFCLWRANHLCAETFCRLVSHIAWFSSGSFPEILRKKLVCFTANHN